MTPPFEIAGRRIGHGEPPYLIAEAGVNHNGRAELALDLVDAATKAGADAVKFQTFTATSLATADAQQAAYQRRRAAASSQLEMLGTLELSPDSWRAIARRCAERGITFISTPFDAASAQLLAELEVPAFKIGSGDLTNLPLLRATARFGRPMIISTGMATLAEIADAIREVRSAGSPSVAVLHCTSAYPADADDLNLLAIQTLRNEFDAVIGYSDHSLGLTAPIAAVALGACIIEKHLTLDQTMEGPDHAVSLTPPELARLVTELGNVWAALGDGEKRPRPVEREMMTAARRSLVVATNLPADHCLVEADLVAKRPGTGISPMRVDEVVGRRLRRAVSADEVIHDADLKPPPRASHGRLR